MTGQQKEILRQLVYRCILCPKSNEQLRVRQLFDYVTMLNRRATVDFDVKVEEKNGRLKLSFKNEKGHKRFLDADAEEVGRLAKQLEDDLKRKFPNGTENVDNLDEAILLGKSLSLYVWLKTDVKEIPEEKRQEVDGIIFREEKTRYLIRSFRHTHYKDYENYVVMGIWHRIECDDELRGKLRPVTQQYVKRTDGVGHKFALLDLFFPDLHMAIECDEAYHLFNKGNDALREGAIFAAYKTVQPIIGEKNKYRDMTVSAEDAVSAEGVDIDRLEIARVDASRSYDEIDRQLDKIVEQIRERYKKAKREGESPEWDTRSAEEQMCAAGRITIQNHNWVFEDIPAVLTALNIRQAGGDSEYEGWQRGGMQLEEGLYLWLPHLSYDAGGWKNRWSDDGEWIYESRISEADYNMLTGHGNERENLEMAREYHKQRALAGKDWRVMTESKLAGKRVRRITFAHSRNALGEMGYRFIGVFELNGYEGDACQAPGLS